MSVRAAGAKETAGLFIDWALSKEGQTMVTTFGRVAARLGINQRFPELGKKEYFLQTPIP